MATFFRRTKRVKSLIFDTFSTLSVSYLRETGWNPAIIDRFCCKRAYVSDRSFLCSFHYPSWSSPNFLLEPLTSTWVPALISLRLYCIQFMITLIIISFSSGLDSAIIIVSATSVPSSIFFFPSENSASFLSRKYRNIVAAILLFPSKKLWFFVTKYKRLAAFSYSDS